MCTARLFSQGVDLFALKFYLYRVVPVNNSWRQKTRNTGLPEVKTASLCVLTQYRRVTDRRTDGFAVAYTALAKLALRSAVKIFITRIKIVKTFVWKK